MAFRPIPSLVAYTDNQGRPLEGGTLRFYDAGTTTPRSVYSDSTLATSLGSTVTLDAAGRVPTGVEVWGTGSYRIRLYDASNVLIDEASPVLEEGALGLAFPTLSANPGKFLTTDGSALQFADVRQVPDPAGNANKVLSTDGSVLTWITKPANGAPGANGVSGVTNSAGGILFNDGTTKFQLKMGTGTLPASGAHTASVAVTFGVTYSVPPLFIGLTPTINVVTAAGYQIVLAATNITTTGFTCNGDVDSSASGSNINVPVPFQWMAIGAVP